MLQLRTATMRLIAAGIVFFLPAAARAISENEEFQRALDLLQNDKVGESIPLWEDLVLKNPTKAIYWYNLGTAHYNFDNCRDAIGNFKTVLALQTQLKPLAQLYLAKCYRKQGDLNSARNLIFILSRERLPPHVQAAVRDERDQLVGPAESVNKEALDRAMTAYQTGLYRQALEIFDTVNKQTPSAEVATMKGLTLLRMGEPEEARGAFAQVLKLAPNPELRDNAIFFIKQIRENLWTQRKPYWAWLDASVGYNSNFYENGFSEPVSASPLMQVAAAGGYHFFQDQPLSFEPTAIMSLQEVFNIAAAQFATMTAEVPGYFFSHEWLIQLTPYFQFQFLGGSGFVDKPGVTLRVQRSFGAQDVGLTIDYSDNNAQQAQFAYIDGPTRLAKLYWATTTRKNYFSVFYADLNEDIGDLPYANGTLPLGDHIYGPGLIATFYPETHWELTGTLSYYKRDYFDATLPAGLPRNDTQTVAFAKASYILNHELRFYGSVEATFNQSTMTQGQIADKNFDKFITLAGLTWNILP